METLVPGRMPRTGLLLLPLLLCFGPETARSINPAALRDIVNYVDEYAVWAQYAFAVSLNRTYCQNASGLDKELPESELQSMRNVINQEGGLYDPADGHIVAAQMQRLGRAGEHAEWRLLRGGQNSPVRKLLARTYNESSCLIFFTLNSPCAGMCLQENGPYSILRMVNDTFGPIDNNYKAYVFRQIYWEDRENLDSQSLLQAWHRLPNMPLYRCFRKHCWDCSRNNRNKINNCLSGM